MTKNTLNIQAPAYTLILLTSINCIHCESTRTYNDEHNINPTNNMEATDNEDNQCPPSNDKIHTGKFRITSFNSLSISRIYIERCTGDFIYDFKITKLYGEPILYEPSEDNTCIAPLNLSPGTVNIIFQSELLWLSGDKVIVEQCGQPQEIEFSSSESTSYYEVIEPTDSYYVVK